MTEVNWRRVEEHFAVLFDLPPDQRNAALSAIADPEMRNEVASLLQHARESETIDDAVAALVTHVTTIGARTTQVGPYRLVRCLGQGGQGAVFEAVRDDGSFEQRVAIKVIRWDSDSESARSRFRSERQFLAGLSHPYIARLLDGGDTDQGSPYLVLEFIDGLPLTQATEGWTARRKLELFLKVLAGVSYAHQNLIVHRDLKPANILVTPGDNPKLLDFGIARLLEPDATRTATTHQAMTPQYASPEQVLGGKITTATDVYSLGVVLYELLKGLKPYTVDGTAPLEMARVICEQPPAPPALSDELDHVVLMALRKEPERRYASAREFAEDIVRWLERRPVVARPDTLRYRSAKFIQRHWFVLGAVTAIILALTGGVVSSRRQALIAQEQARIANQRYKETRELANRVLFDFQDRLALLPGTIETRSLLANTALQYLSRLSESSQSGDPQLLWEVAQAYQRLSQVLGPSTRASLGRLDEAISAGNNAVTIEESLLARGALSQTQIENLLQHYIQLGNLYRLAWRDREGTQRVAAGLDTARHYVPARLPQLEIVLARSYLRIGQIKRARQLLDDVAGQIIGRGQEPLAHPEIEARTNSFAAAASEVALRSGDLERSLAFRRMAAAHKESNLQRDPSNYDYGAVLAADVAGEAVLLGPAELPNLGRPAAAAPVAQRALRLAEAALLRDPENRPPHTLITSMLLLRARSIQSQQPAQAVDIYYRALDEAKKAGAEFASHPEFGATYLYSIIPPLARTGRMAEAREFFQRAQEFLGARLKKDPSDLFAAYHLAGAWMNWAGAQPDAAAALPANEAAERLIRDGIALAPDDFFLAWRLAQILEQRRPWLDALQRENNARQLEELRKTWPDLSHLLR